MLMRFDHGPALRRKALSTHPRRLEGVRMGLRRGAAGGRQGPSPTGTGSGFVGYVFTEMTMKRR